MFGDEEERELPEGGAPAEGDEHEEVNEENGSEGESQGEDESQNEGEEEVVDAVDGAEEAPARRPSRREQRIVSLRNELAETKRQTADLQRQVQDFQRVSQTQAGQRTADQEQAALALMTPEERINYRLTKAEQNAAQTLRQIEFRTQNQTDRMAYSAKAAANPTYAKYQDRVEAEFDKAVAKGAPVEREVILKFLLGDDALKSATGARVKQAKQGERRIAQQRTAPNNSRGDATSQRGKAGDTPEARLKGVYI